MKTKSNNEIGKAAEDLVARGFGSFGFQVLSRNMKVLGVEVDLIVKDIESRISIVEVKSLSSDLFSSNRVSKKQKKRLVRAAQALSDSYHAPVDLKFAFCHTKSGLVEVFSFDGELELSKVL